VGMELFRSRPFHLIEEEAVGRAGGDLASAKERDLGRKSGKLMEAICVRGRSRDIRM
jgi:hypothetical protein